MGSDIDIKRTHQQIEHIWLLVRDAHVREAKAKSEKLVYQLQTQLEKTPNEHDLQQALMHAHHIAGYTAAMSTRSYDALIPASYFSEMEHVARALQDDVYVVIALTYQGDMHRRYGNMKQALQYLQTAYDTPITDSAAHGNCAQLLARVYSQQDDYTNFLRMMKEAEQIALHDDSLQNSLHGQYCLGTVYIEYARYYSKIGQFHQALDFYTQAKIALPETPHWTTFLTAIQGLLLIKGGDVEQGIPVVVKAVELAQKHGNHRLLDNFYALQRYLGQKALEFNRASVRLGDTLHRLKSDISPLLSEQRYPILEKEG